MKELYLASSVQELVKIAEESVPPINQNTKLMMYYRTAEQMIMQSNIYKKEGDFEKAYVMLFMFSVFVLDRAPKHQQYKDATLAKFKNDARQKVEKILDELEGMKIVLSNAYSARELLYQEQWVCGPHTITASTHLPTTQREEERRRREEETRFQKEQEEQQRLLQLQAQAEIEQKQREELEARMRQMELFEKQQMQPEKSSMIAEQILSPEISHDSVAQPESRESKMPVRENEAQLTLDVGSDFAVHGLENIDCGGNNLMIANASSIDSMLDIAPVVPTPALIEDAPTKFSHLSSLREPFEAPKSEYNVNIENTPVKYPTLDPQSPAAVPYVPTSRAPAVIIPPPSAPVMTTTPAQAAYSAYSNHMYSPSQHLPPRVFPTYTTQQTPIQPPLSTQAPRFSNQPIPRATFQQPISNAPIHPRQSPQIQQPQPQPPQAQQLQQITPNNNNVYLPNVHAARAAAPAAAAMQPPKQNKLIEQSPMFDLGPSQPKNTAGLRKVVLFGEMFEAFMRLAQSNTARRIETCGILCGTLSQDRFKVTTLIIPKQEGTTDTCSATDEQEFFEYQMANDLLTLDLHTHSSYQYLLAEAVAVVISPMYTPNFGVFRISDPPGMQVLQKCNLKGFHQHDIEGKYLYTTCDHVEFVWGTKNSFKIVDQR